MKLIQVIYITFLFLCCNNVVGSLNGSKILFIYPITTVSETHLFLPIAKSLAKNGHDVTIVTPIQTDKLPNNIHQIVPTTPMKDTDFFITSNIMTERKLMKNKFKYLTSFDFGIIYKRCHTTYQNENFQKLLIQKYDLIFMSGTFHDCMEGIIYKLNVPYILLSSMAFPQYMTTRIGFHLPPSFVPIPFFDFPTQMKFIDRFINTFMVWVLSLVMVSNIEICEQIYRQYLGQDIPGRDEIGQNISLIMSNSHFAINKPFPLLPDMIEIGGVHCRPPKPLPKDLNDFISNAKHGVIFFSLGSVVQTKSLPDSVIKIFLNVFSKLKQQILWKWDTEEMIDLPINIKLAKWLPQQDVLGHPNVKLFISHGGLLSTQEATYHGVPMLGIPVFVDQDINMIRAEESGYALLEEILDMTEESLENKINKMLTESRFMIQAKRMSSIFKDQPQTSLERATFWIEYILRHKGASHMKSQARNLNFIQYHSIDVVAVIVSVIITLIIVITWMVRKLCCGLQRKLNTTTSSQNKKKN